MYTSNNGPMIIPIQLGAYVFNLGVKNQVVAIEEVTKASEFPFTAHFVNNEFFSLINKE